MFEVGGNDSDSNIVLVESIFSIVKIMFFEI